MRHDDFDRPLILGYNIGADHQVRCGGRISGVEPEAGDGHRDRVRLPIAHPADGPEPAATPNGDAGGDCVRFTTTSPDPPPPVHLTFSPTLITEPARMYSASGWMVT
jgi:hypothetical protein